MNKQKERISKNDKSKIFLVLDDCLSSRIKWENMPLFRELIFNHKSYNITLIITFQYPHSFSSAMRSVFDFVFLLRDYVIHNLKKICRHYGSMFPTFESFKGVFKMMIKDNGKMVIVKTIKNKITDKIFQCNQKK